TAQRKARGKGLDCPRPVPPDSTIRSRRVTTQQGATAMTQRRATCCPECYGQRRSTDCDPCAAAKPKPQTEQRFELTLNGRRVGSLAATPAFLKILLLGLNRAGETWQATPQP